MKNSYIYGFEDYTVNILYSYNLLSTYDTRICSYSTGRIFLIPENFPINVSYDDSLYQASFNPPLFTENMELLESAKKVYIHPACKISRSMVATKYKKCLNPWVADAVVLPNAVSSPDFHKTMVFINESVKAIFITILYNSDADKFVNITFGTKIRDIICNCPIVQYLPFSSGDVLDAELFYRGDILEFDSDNDYLLNIITGNIPKDKIVLENTLQKSLGGEHNQLTLESLVSIGDMMSSSDADTVSAGLKALSCMDWMHYPNSVRYMIRSIPYSRNSWKFNKAINSTSVKFMMTSLARSSNRRRFPGDFDDTIYEEDYELLKQLVMHYNPETKNDEIFTNMAYMNFMYVTAEGMLKPRLKTA